MKQIFAPLALLIMAACQPATNFGPTGTPVADPAAALAAFPDLRCRVADFQTNDRNAGDRFINGNRAKRYAIRIEGQTIITDVTSDIFSDSTDRFAVSLVTETQIFGGDPRDFLGSTIVIDRQPVNGQYRALDRILITRADGSVIADNRWTLACVPA